MSRGSVEVLVADVFYPKTRIGVRIAVAQVPWVWRLKLVCLPRVSPSVSPDTCPSCIGSPLKTAPLTYSLRPRRAVPSVWSISLCFRISTSPLTALSHPSPSAFPSSSQLEGCPLSSQISYAKLDSFQISYAKLDLGRNDLKLIAVS